MLGCFFVGNSVLMVGQFLKTSTDKGKMVRFQFLRFARFSWKNGPKKDKFLDWLKTHSKVLNAKKQKCSTPFWGDVGIKKWSCFFCFGARSAIFCHLKPGTFAKSARFQVPKNGTSGAETKKRRPLFNANIPPKWCRALLFQAFSTFGWVLGQSKNLPFFGLFFQLKRAKRKKWNRTIFPLSVEVFKNCPIIRTLLPTKKQPRDFASWQKCQNVSLYCWVASNVCTNIILSYILHPFDIIYYCRYMHVIYPVKDPTIANISKHIFSQLASIKFFWPPLLIVFTNWLHVG